MKRNERMICLVMTFLLCLGLAAGCGREEETDPAQIEGTYLCFVNNDGDGLVREEYEIKGDSTEEEIEDIVSENTQGKIFGVFGEETVNVLKVNIEIAQRMGIL